MSGFLNNLHERHEQHRERREERREARHDHRGRHDQDDDEEPGRHHGRGRRDDDDDDDDNERRSHSYEPQYESRGGYAPPTGQPPSARGPSAFATQGGLDRGDFASDVDIDRMIATGEFDKRQGRPGGDVYGYGGGGGGRYDAPSGPPPGQGYGERAGEYGRYGVPSGPPPGRGHQGQQSLREDYGSSGAHASGYGGGSDRQEEYGQQQQTQGRPRHEVLQGAPPGHGRGQGNAPSGGFVTPRDGEERYGSGYSGPPNDRSEPSRRGEAASYYDQQGQGDRYAHLAGMAQEHGDGDPELYRRATQGLNEKIQSQAQAHRPGRDGEDDYKSHVDAHRKAYGSDDHGPMDADTIGAAAAMEAFKQTAAAAGSSHAPVGAFQAGKTGAPSKQGYAAQEEEEEGTAAARAGASGGLQDKLMALAMSHAGKLFDKKNAGSGAGGGSQDKAQAMQSAAATAMELFTQYQTKGKLESGDMSKVMGLAMKLL